MTVIVAESDEARRRARCLALAEAGYVVVEAETGLAALTKMAADSGPVVAVVDSRLPDLDGAEVARFAQRALRTGRQLAVVLLTADARRVSARLRRTTDDAFVRVLSKSFTHNELLRAVRAAEWAMVAGEPTRMEAISYG